jgi:hypothetical protein
MIDIKWCTPNTAALQLCSPHASPDAFDNERTLQFGYCGDDDHYRPTKSTVSVNGLALGEELDPEFIEFIEYLQEMFRAPGQSIARPDQHRIEAAALRILQQVIQGWTSHLRPTDPMINVLLNNFIAALPRKLTEFGTLCLRVLVNR